MYYTRALAVMRALVGGLGDVFRAPALVIASAAAMLAIAVAFGAVLGAQLQQSLTHQEAVARGSAEIDADWWQDFVEHADGLAATFTPMVLGFSAPLDNLSSLLDGTRRPPLLIAPIAIAILAWAYLWGAALDRFAHGQRGFWHAGRNTLLPFAGISLLAAGLVLTLYVTVHPLVFELGGRGGAGGRIAAYAIFGLLLVAVSVAADYARVGLVLSPDLSIWRSIRQSWQFIGAHPGAVFGLYLATGALFVLLLAVYGAFEIATGSPAGWRAIGVAQAYIIARIVIRLSFGASELRLWRALGPAQGASSLLANAGPPAAT